jgi:hypothetical protein
MKDNHGYSHNGDEYITEKFDFRISENLREELENVKFDHSLKMNILDNTINRKKNILEKITDFMNKTIEIPIGGIVTVCFIAVVLSSSLSVVTSNMKNNRDIMGYSNIKIVQINGSNIIIPNTQCEVDLNEKN